VWAQIPDGNLHPSYSFTKMIEICPKCLGQGTVSMPPFIDGNILYWIDNVSGGYTCKVYGGMGYVKC
jgi:hypothetical protein